MKNNFKTLMTGMVLLTTCAVGNAQNTDNRGFGGGKTGEQSVETRGNAIAKELGLDASTTKKFLSVYKKEQSAMQELMPSRGQRPEGNPPSGQRPQGNPPQGAPGDMEQGGQFGGQHPQGNPPSGDFQQNETDQNCNNSSRRRGPQMSEETRKKMEEVQTKYKKQYGKFLSEEQIQKVYQHQGGPRRQNNGNSTGTK